MEQGMLYGVGVGPGDPELMTMAAIRAIEQCDTVAVPQSGAREQTALGIAAAYVADKPVLHCEMPMTHDKARRAACHDKAADEICALLDEGKTVAFLTLGDPTVYSTYWYVHKRVAARGYRTKIVPGVPSFCAAAAAAGRALCMDGEMLHIVPASHGQTEAGLALDGGKVLMKAGKSILDARDSLAACGELDNAVLVERCGMEGERIVTDLRTLTEPAGYFSVILVREDER